MLTETKEGVLLSIKVTPKARQNQIGEWENGFLKIRVMAPPEKGEANQAVIALLAKKLGIPKSNIRLLRGESSRTKQVCLIGLSKEKAEALLP